MEALFNQTFPSDSIDIGCVAWQNKRYYCKYGHTAGTLPSFFAKATVEQTQNA